MGDVKSPTHVMQIAKGIPTFNSKRGGKGYLVEEVIQLIKWEIFHQMKVIKLSYSIMSFS